MTVIATLLVIPDAILALAWLRLSARRRWLAAWFASWFASVVAITAALLYTLGGDAGSAVAAGGIALMFAVGRFLWGPFGPRYASTGRHR